MVFKAYLCPKVLAHRVQDPSGLIRGLTYLKRFK